MKNSNFNVSVMTKAAILTAITIILERFLSVMLTPTLRIGLSWMPLVLIGVLYGPYVGGIAGLVSDLVGVMINAQGTFHPGFTLSAVLTGLIPGIISFYLLKNVSGYKKVTISCIVVAIIVHMGLNTFWLSQLMGKGFLALLPVRSLKVVLETIAIIITGNGLYSILKKIK